MRPSSWCTSTVAPGSDSVTWRAPLVQQLGGAGHVPGLVPAGVIGDRDVGDADVVVQHREDVAVPELVDVSCGGVGVESHGPLA